MKTQNKGGASKGGRKPLKFENGGSGAGPRAARDDSKGAAQETVIVQPTLQKDPKESGKGLVSNSIENDIVTNEINDSETKKEACDSKSIPEDMLGNIHSKLAALENTQITEERLREYFVDLSADLTSKIGAISERNLRLEEKNKILTAKCNFQERRLLSLTERLDILENKEKRRNIVIEGIKESDNLNLRDQLDELFKELKVSFKSIETEACYRLGERKEYQKRPRPIMVRFATIRQKQQVYANITNLKNNKSKWEYTSICDDLSVKDQEERRNLLNLISFCKSKGKEAKLSGNGLIFEGKRYAYQEVNNLPKGFRMLDIKTVATDQGVMFGGPFSYLSPEFPVEINHEGNTYSSAECFYRSKQASSAGDEQLSFEIRMAKDINEVRDLSGLIKKSQKWDKKQKISTMKLAQQLKFTQNVDLKRDLLETTGDLINCSFEKFWGCGLVITQRKYIKKKHSRDRIIWVSYCRPCVMTLSSGT